MHSIVELCAYAYYNINLLEAPWIVKPHGD